VFFNRGVGCMPSRPSYIREMKILFQLSVAVSASLILAAPVRRSKEAVLHELNTAVVSADGQAVIRLTDELKALVPAAPAVSSLVANTNSLAPVASHEQKRDSRRTLLSPSSPMNNSVGLVAKAVVQAGSIFDDTIFHLSPEAKKELQAEIAGPAADALGWIQTGGWYHCAYEAQPCKCAGEVRYGAPHTGQWSASVSVGSGNVLCTADIFGDPAPGSSKQCNCHRSSFSLTKNENSGSYLQESWIFMLRFLARTKQLPFTGDRRYHGIELWSARHGGHTGGTLERYWIEKYIVEQYKNIPGGKCLEWGLYYVNWLHQCTEKYENKYEAVLYGEKQPSVEGNIVYGSIYDFPTVVGNAGIQFNFICATELFEHLEKPYEAAADLFHILAPGGAVLFTAPQQAQYHKVPQDFLRYTKEGAKHVMEVAGFCVPPQLMAGSGDFIFDVGRNTGLQLQDFTVEELDEGFQRGYDNIADGAITIHAMAFKPPHAYCR